MLLSGESQSAEVQPAVNQEILTGWYELSVRLGAALHTDEDIPENANFATFAAWSAETLRAEIARGQTAGGGGGPGRPSLRRPFRQLYEATAEMLLGDSSIIGANFVVGEVRIFEEIGQAMERLLETLDDEPPAAGDGSDTDRWRVLWSRFSAELPNTWRHVNLGRTDSQMAPADVEILQVALRPYFEVVAKGLDHPGDDARKRKQRAELVLLGNIRCVAYEQKRLQPVLSRNMAFLPDAVRVRLGSGVMGHMRPMSVMLRRAYTRAATATAIIDEAFEIATTRHLYTLVIGDEKFRLGRDLPLPPAANAVLRDRQPERDRARYGQDEFFPYHLQQLENPEAWAAWQRYDRSNGEGARTRVDNWLRLYERLNFIVNLFRSRQQVSAVYNRPKSARVVVHCKPAALGRVSTVSVETEKTIEDRLTVADRIDRVAAD